jgi:hypothetical protein
VTRQYASPSGPGHLHWSIEAIKKDRGGLRTKLRTAYAENAIPPASPWLGSSAPGPVFVAPAEEGGNLTLTFKPEPSARWRVIQIQNGNQWTTLRTIPAAQDTFRIPGTPSTVSIRHLGPTGILSLPTVIARK